MASTTFERTWSKQELEFYTTQAKQHKTLVETLSLATEEGFPERTPKQVRNALCERGASWTQLGGKDGRNLQLGNNQKIETLPISEKVVLDKKIEQLRAEHELLGRKYRHLLRERNFQDAALNLIQTGIQAIPYRDPKFRKPELKKDQPLIEESLIMFVADLHTGEVVSPAETMGFGNYNFEIFQRRMEQYVDIVLRFHEDILKTYYHRKLHMFCLGDWVAGIIHEELRETAGAGIMQEVVGCVTVMEQVILDLLPHFPEIELSCVVGNHGRLEKQVRFKRKSQDSFDWLVYTMLAQRLSKYPQIKFNISQAPYLLVTVENHTWLLMHGDTVKGWAGIPFYGVERETRKWGDLFGIKNENFEYVALGHFHTPYTLPRPGGGKVFGSGAVIGPTEFSLAVTNSVSPPSQWLMGMHERKGISLTADIHLSDWVEKLSYRYNFKI